MKKHKVIIDKKENIASRVNFDEKIKEYIEVLDERIKRLIEKGLDVSDEGTEKYDSQLEKLIKQRKELALMKNSLSELGEKKWDEIKESIHHDFECLKDEVEVTYESIMSIYNQLKKKFRWNWKTGQHRDGNGTTEVI